MDKEEEKLQILFDRFQSHLLFLSKIKLLYIKKKKSA